MKKPKKLKKHNKKRSSYAQKLNSESVGDVQILSKVISTRTKISTSKIQKILELSDTATEQFELKGRGCFLTVYEFSGNQYVYVPSKNLFEIVVQLVPEALPKIQSVIKDYDPVKEYVSIAIFSRKFVAITIDVKRFYSELTKW